MHFVVMLANALSNGHQFPDVSTSGQNTNNIWRAILLSN